jgi:glycosyltransferase involved in cell wall biosynthesis
MDDFELLVVDNASTDETPDVLASFRDDRLRVHRNDSNVGLFGNFRRCLELTSGELVKFLAADDWLLPGSLSTAVDLMRRHPTAAIASGPGLYVDDHGAVFGVGVTGVFAPGLVPGADALRAQARFLNVVGMPSNTVLRRQALDAAGGFDEQFAPAADIHLWGKLLATHDLVWMDRPLCFLRFHTPPRLTSTASTRRSRRSWPGRTLRTQDRRG